MISIKKGASFRVALQFETSEWGSIFPVDLIASQMKQGDDLRDIEVEIDESTRCIILRAETTNWTIGRGKLDVKLVRGDLITVIPELTNIDVTVLEGVTE